jgi:GNAT superfamily N-acetyltransferase
LIADRTYFAVDRNGVLIGCGGWSKRRALFGSDAHRSEGNPELNPAADPARIRAFFVHPQFARQGIARAIMEACEKAIFDAGFRRVEISATLAGEPLYVAFGYIVVERYHLPMRANLQLPVVRLAKSFSNDA